MVVDVVVVVVVVFTKSHDVQKYFAADLFVLHRYCNRSCCCIVVVLLVVVALVQVLLLLLSLYTYMLYIVFGVPIATSASQCTIPATIHIISANGDN